MRYLSYHSHRRNMWKEHDSFPHQAVRYWKTNGYGRGFGYGTVPLIIFEMSEDRTAITFIPETEWLTP